MRYLICLQPIFTVSSQDQLISLLTVDQMQDIKEIYAGNPVCYHYHISVDSRHLLSSITLLA